MNNSSCCVGPAVTWDQLLYQFLCNVQRERAHLIWRDKASMLCRLFDGILKTAYIFFRPSVAQPKEGYQRACGCSHACQMMFLRLMMEDIRYELRGSPQALLRITLSSSLNRMNKSFIKTTVRFLITTHSSVLSIIYILINIHYIPFSFYRILQMLMWFMLNFLYLYSGH